LGWWAAPRPASKGLSPDRMGGSRHCRAAVILGPIADVPFHPLVRAVWGEHTEPQCFLPIMVHAVACAHTASNGGECVLPGGARSSKAAAQYSLKRGRTQAANRHVLDSKNLLAPPSQYPATRFSVQVVCSKVLHGLHL